MTSSYDTSTHWLSKRHPGWVTVYTSFCAFGLYTCVYGIRKAFPAATFEEVYLGTSFKVWLVIAQAIGYSVSKCIGVKIISELKAHGRRTLILVLSGVSAISWFFFAITPAPYSVIFLFTNGLPLGMIWGIIFGYLEGRKTTDMLAAALSVSFIFSSGFARSVGSYLIIVQDIDERWMPFMAALLFIGPLFAFAVMLDRVPAPNADDVLERSKRQPMDRNGRMRFISTFLPGIVVLVIAYTGLTVFRDFRDNFSAEIWREVGMGNSYALFTQTEIPVSLLVLVVIGLMTFVRNHRIALLLNHLIVLTGFSLVVASTYLFQRNMIPPPLWMTILGLGLYLGYVPFNSIFFERLVAAFRLNGTVGFVMYLADSIGYLGSLFVLFYREFALAKLSWVRVFVAAGYFIGVLGFALMLCSLLYFNRKLLRSGLGITLSETART